MADIASELGMSRVNVTVASPPGKRGFIWFVFIWRDLSARYRPPTVRKIIPVDFRDYPIQRSLRRWRRGAVQQGMCHGSGGHRVQAGAQSVQKRAVKILGQNKERGRERADPAAAALARSGDLSADLTQNQSGARVLGHEVRTLKKAAELFGRAIANCRKRTTEIGTRLTRRWLALC